MRFCVTETAAVDVLTDGCGRGYTVLCTMRNMDLLASLASIAGVTGLVVAVGQAPVMGNMWQAIRCDPALGIPVRSHVIDAAVIAETADLADVAEEVRRVLAPGGDVRVLLTGTADAAAALRGAAITPLRQEAGVLVARGP
jgi:hypothetical protein